MIDPHLVCRSCGAPLSALFVDLGMSPISNAMRSAEQAGKMEPFFPLRAFVCGVCKLVQIEDVVGREEHFNDHYTYFSSSSTTWLAHARAYAGMMTKRFALGEDSLVVEAASNDGYLLQYFKAGGVPVQGVDPADNCAEAARAAGVPTLTRFFGAELAAELRAEGRMADVIAANNVLAHVPDINDFVSGFQGLLKPGGVITVEFPHLLRLIEANYFDTIYHEHYSYLSLLAVERLFARHGLEAFDLEELTTHGGSLRLFAGHTGAHPGPSAALAAFRAREASAGFDDLSAYAGFADKVQTAKHALLELLIRIKNDGRSIVAYGAPAKGNTLLNYCGIRTDFIDYAVDVSSVKQGMFLPGTGIPVYAPDRIAQTRPDYVLILPWNLKDEIVGQMAAIRDWGGRFILPLPQPVVLE